MYPPVEAIIHPENREHDGRLFVVEGLELERYANLIGRAMNVYAEVTGVEYSMSQLRYPPKLVEDLQRDYSFERRFGIPRLSEPAQTDGKLWGKIHTVRLGEASINAVAFSVDTNDCDALHPQPEPSKALCREFTVAVRHLADAEFDDIAVPAPSSAASWYYPAIAPNR